MPDQNIFLCISTRVKNQLNKIIPPKTKPLTSSLVAWSKRIKNAADKNKNIVFLLILLMLSPQKEGDKKFVPLQNYNM